MEIEEFMRERLHIADEALIEAALPMCRMVTVRKGVRLIRQGELAENIDFLVSGICRSFFVDGAGRDITDCLICTPGGTVVASSDPAVPAPVTIEALLDTTIFRISVPDFRLLLARYPAVEQLYRALLLESSEYHRELKILSYQFTARERYHWFLKKFPGVIELISHKHVASFLNMTPITLSRLISAERGGGAAAAVVPFNLPPNPKG